jgi:hypothetical protein
MAKGNKKCKFCSTNTAPNSTICCTFYTTQLTLASLQRAQPSAVDTLYDNSGALKKVVAASTRVSHNSAVNCQHCARSALIYSGHGWTSVGCNQTVLYDYSGNYYQ